DPRAALRARRDDPGGARPSHRRHAADRHRHRAGAVLAVAGDGLLDRPRLPGAAGGRLPLPRDGGDMTTSMRRTARFAGALYLVVAVLGFFGYFVARGTVHVPGDAAA